VGEIAAATARAAVVQVARGVHALGPLGFHAALVARVAGWQALGRSPVILFDVARVGRVLGVRPVGQPVGRVLAVRAGVRHVRPAVAVADAVGYLVASTGRDADPEGGGYGGLTP